MVATAAPEIPITGISKKFNGRLIPNPMNAEIVEIIGLPMPFTYATSKPLMPDIIIPGMRINRAFILGRYAVP